MFEDLVFNTLGIKNNYIYGSDKVYESPDIQQPRFEDQEFLVVEDPGIINSSNLESGLRDMNNKLQFNFNTNWQKNI